MIGGRPEAVDEIIGESRVRIGRFTYGRENLIIMHYDQGASLTIGSFCSLARGITVFLGGEHDHSRNSTYPFGAMFVDELGTGRLENTRVTKGEVTIGSDVWIGDGASIMSGITIGDGAVIAARAHVVKNVKPDEIVGGNPARHIKYRFDEQICELLGKLQWWDWPVDLIREASSSLQTQPDVTSLRKLVELRRRALMVPAPSGAANRP